MIDIDTKLTVVLFLKDRVNFTYRWLYYHNVIAFPFRILMADGGKDETIQRVLSGRNSHPNLDYEYYRYPYDANYSIYHAKKADILSRVETPFVVLTDNDDFLVVEALRKSVQFLLGNDEYVACGGDLFAFELEPEINDLFGNSVNFIHQPPPSGIEQKTAMERVRHHFINYFTTYYDVHRTVVARKLYRQLYEFDTKDVTISELLTSFMTVAMGKVKKLQDAYLLRQVHLDTNCYREDIMYDRFDRMLRETWSDDFSKFVDAVVGMIIEKDHSSVEEAANNVKKGYRQFIAPIITNCLSSDVSIPNKSAKSQTVAFLSKLYKFKKMFFDNRIKNSIIPKAHKELIKNEFVLRISKFLTDQSMKEKIFNK
ncbi:MAG: TIGR00180 family glycosyltransferase [Prolixibacteraceae bacterium]|nr:TIGR00180 family glycosyltransferase [Prolixibacteraceae bacterium]